MPWFDDFYPSGLMRGCSTRAGRHFRAGPTVSPSAHCFCPVCLSPCGGSPIMSSLTRVSGSCLRISTLSRIALGLVLLALSNFDL